MFDSALDSVELIFWTGSFMKLASKKQFDCDKKIDSSDSRRLKKNYPNLFTDRKYNNGTERKHQRKSESDLGNCG
jgi:hypothetical protein